MQEALFDIGDPPILWHTTGYDSAAGTWFVQVLYGYPGIEVLGGARRPARSEAEAHGLVPELTRLVRERFNPGRRAARSINEGETK